MSNTPVPAAASGLPKRRLTHADEFLQLTDTHRQIGRRLNELAELLGPAFSAALPKSGLRIVAITAKGGRAHA